MHSFSLSHSSFRRVYRSFFAEMSDTEPVAEGTKENDPSANPKPPSSELVDKVFPCLKVILILNAKFKES